MTVEAQALMAPDAKVRATAYRWLAGLFAREMTADAVALYRSADGSALLDALAALPALEPLAQALRARVAMEVPAEVMARDLAGIYGRLFHGAGGRRSAPPCASFYISKTARMMQAEAGDTQSALDALDLRLTDQMREPPDHVAVQLAVMAHLAETNDRAAQADWLAHRLVPWLDAFAARCAQAPRPDIYATAARAAAQFCAADLKQIGGRHDRVP